MPKKKSDKKKDGLDPSKVWKNRKGGITQKGEDLEELKVALKEEKKIQSPAKEVEEFVDTLDEVDDVDDELYPIEEDDELKVADFNTLWAERRRCYVPVISSLGDIVHIPIHSLTEKERSDIISDKRCIVYHFNKKTHKKEIKEYDQNMIVVLTVWAALDDEFKNTIMDKDGNELEEDKKVEIFFDNIPMGDLAFLQEAIHKISGIDVENIELIKKDFGLLASRKKDILRSLLSTF